MQRAPSRRTLLLALAAAAIVAGVAVALAAGGGGGHGHKRAKAAAAPVPGELTVAARYLGISRGALRRRLRGATLAEVASTTPGRSVAGLEAALLAAHEQQWRLQGLSASERAARAKRLLARLGEDLVRSRRATSDLAFAASYLSLSEAKLRAKLLGGRSLAELAEAAPGHSRAGLIGAIVGRRRQQLEQSLAAHRITPEQEQAAAARLDHRVAREVDRVLARG